MKSRRSRTRLEHLDKQRLAHLRAAVIETDHEIAIYHRKTAGALTFALNLLDEDTYTQEYLDCSATTEQEEAAA